MTLPRNPGRGRTPHANHWSERLDTKGMWSSLMSLAEARTNRKRVYWARKCSYNDRKERTDLAASPEGRVTSHGGGRNFSGSAAFEKFLRNKKISREVTQTKSFRAKTELRADQESVTVENENPCQDIREPGNPRVREGEGLRTTLTLARGG